MTLNYNDLKKEFIKKQKRLDRLNEIQNLAKARELAILKAAQNKNKNK